ncbi:hypothetical protein [Flexilinea flocculi]|jgi:hypothetical protein|uniref:N-acetyltransferase domain-containing protein n=1 Tax=Flexilinea flocculi TaxID=1678840 RepID=A0A0K8PCU9_9CHLR|nr:hypothetical protein [Flexilinea flocculi]NMB94884.1 hypothetical protein [Flexilinea flocculi]GAP39970.1 hypothetical protein ATC1_12509 [Flexilinea flocculi]
MVEIRLVNTDDKKQVKQFVQFHYDLYKGDPNWVPPFRGDVEVMLNKKKHPFYDHSEADFFTAWKNGKMAGRIAALMNNSYNNYHQLKTANLFLFDSINDQEVANALFDAAIEWARKRGLNEIIGPKGFSLFDGYGVLTDGFDERQMMNMSAYNYPYYKNLYEAYGFRKCNEFVSMSFKASEFVLPEKVQKVAEIVQKRGTLKVIAYKSRKEFVKNAQTIANLYAKSFENNWEYFPMSFKEIQFLIDNVLKMVDPKMVKFITNEKQEIVGFLITFPDLSAAMQRHNGYLTPALILDLLLEIRRTKKVTLNGFGILEEYRRRGGDALLYSSMSKLLEAFPQFVDAEATQMAESAKEVQLEMIALGLKPKKHHRIYKKEF